MKNGGYSYDTKFQIIINKVGIGNRISIGRLGERLYLIRVILKVGELGYTVKLGIRELRKVGKLRKFCEIERSVVVE